jgi:CRISPR-associated protein Csm4
MNTYLLKITPRSAFGTSLHGDTLFGQLCWAIRNRFGEDRLRALLEGYTDGRPFAVASDAFPAGFVPRPSLPAHWYREIDGIDRKAAKKRAWIPVSALQHPIDAWLNYAKSSGEVFSCKYQQPYLREFPQPHNSINRLTGTTGEGFAPYTQSQTWFLPNVQLEIYVALDNQRLEQNQLRQCLEDVGQIGFGRDASIGLGKFVLDAIEEHRMPSQTNANSCLTLAPCAPQGLGFNPNRSFYQLFTRFGRHGDIAVHQTGQPFKNPVLLARAGAVFGTEPPERGWIGQGLGGGESLSKAIPDTVQQGYTPVIPIHLPEPAEQ